MPAPTVLSTSPVDGAASVYKNTPVTALFSEALDPDTVNAGTAFLESMDSGEVVPAAVTLSADGLMLSVSPTRHLVPNTLHRLTLIGGDTALSTGSIKSLTNDELALTAQYLFTTGDEIQIDSLQKTIAQAEAEGDLNLPSNIQVIPAAAFYPTGSIPANREFGVDVDLEQIVVEFSTNIETSSVDEDSCVVEFFPYYEEDDFFLALPDTSDDSGEPRFKWQEPKDSSDVPLDFDMPTGTLSVSLNRIVWTKDDLTKPFPSNTRCKVTLKPTIVSAAQEPLDGTYRIDFYFDPMPSVVSIDRVRDYFYPYVLTGFTDDLIGKTIYKNAMEALEMIRWTFLTNRIDRSFRDYIFYATVVDVFGALRVDAELLGGQLKRGGDLTVRYNALTEAEYPAKLRAAMAKRDELRDVLEGVYNKVMMPVVRGECNPTQRVLLRTRLWKQDLLHALEGYNLGSSVAGNTVDERATKVPGRLDPW